MIARVLLVVRDRLAVRWHRAHVMGDFADRSRHEALIDAIDDFLDGHAPTGASNPGTSEGNGARESRRKLGCWQAGTGFETQAGLRYGPLARAGRHLVEHQRAWVKLVEAAEVKYASVHTLRHSFASTAAVQGLPLAVIGACLGHKDPRSTGRYAHLAPQESHHVADHVADIYLARRSA